MSIAHGIRTLGVLGSGQMGTISTLVHVVWGNALNGMCISGLGIAYVAALRARVPVLLHDRSEVQLKQGLAFMDKLLDKDVNKVHFVHPPSVLFVPINMVV